ncbi:thiol peroxidase [Caldithrix abyssi DSM 13497]|uniref:Thiol peroxidase n=1 Tax=Caldithrix abyssi DSM 13497 TaxID=880073 RepID=H1XWE6_CALAY|nr:thiol peroxidase [Caldithrix abyssi]APF20788.1 tpx thiol peroxidase (atypical 2-Cys peroxiredoxin) [Caldithrix abyssi DSM 13497]EHO40728.1 thiol peroxidase [Caldithrix abyssi DSM 13497]
MAKITLKGNPINTIGELPAIGNTAPDFSLTTTDLGDVHLKDFSGQRLVLNIFPSLDTEVCATSVRKFNEMAANLENTKVLCISMDLPFAHKRFCTTEGIENVISLSELHERGFGESYGVRIIDGPLRGLFTRAVVVIDEKGKVIYTELVPEITQEPNYEKALKALE